MRFFLLVLCSFLILVPLVHGVDTPTYSDRDPAYTSYQSQIASLYRNMIDGDGYAYVVEDSYVDYYGQSQIVSKTVSPKVLINEPSYYSSDLHRRINRNIPIERYYLRSLTVDHADRVNTADTSEQANLARKTNFGGYLPKDCTSDPSCSTVQWVEKIAYSLRALSASNADTDACPIGTIDDADPALPGLSLFVSLLLTKFPTMIHICQYDTVNEKIYHANSTGSHVGIALYAHPTATYSNVGVTPSITMAQQSGKLSFGGSAQTVATYNFITNEQVNATIERAPNVKTATIIENLYRDYMRGNGAEIITVIP